MNEKLTYEEWRKTLTIEIAEDLKNELKENLNIDAEKEIESAMCMEYENYLNNERKNQRTTRTMH